ncbi:MAG TPA: acyclic terpene utilization AtuA family protein [Anaeromyxobacter sp.]|nr:acyclic terpene utilization AtuA family protein [Anaeromyxobacter sp.]
MRKVRIGAGAGFARDRVEPALELVLGGDIGYLVFECLAERTIATDQLEKTRNPEKGYNAGLDARMRAVLGPCRERGVKIVTNMGSANPVAAARRVKQLARELGLPEAKVAAVEGDDVVDRVRAMEARILETGESLDTIRPRIVSANAYLGAEPMVEALRRGADVVVVGRSADPSLFLAPMMHELGWGADDWGRLGAGTVVGHLLECAGQVTGGYFADPGYKDVPGLARLGFPIAEVREDGEALVTKVPGSGGAVTFETASEQLLYEIHDPGAYVTPDVVADFGGVELEEAAPDAVRVRGGTGRPRTPTLKVSVGYRDSFIGEGQMSYAGPGALERAKLAADVVLERLRLQRLEASETRVDLVGVDSLHGPDLRAGAPAPRGPVPYEVRVRVACRTATAEEAAKVGTEVASLLTNGPAGGAADAASVREIIAILSVLLPREAVRPVVTMV